MSDFWEYDEYDEEDDSESYVVEMSEEESEVDSDSKEIDYPDEIEESESSDTDERIDTTQKYTSINIKGCKANCWACGEYKPLIYWTQEEDALDYLKWIHNHNYIIALNKVGICKSCLWCFKDISRTTHNDENEKLVVYELGLSEAISRPELDKTNLKEKGNVLLFAGNPSDFNRLTMYILYYSGRHVRF